MIATILLFPIMLRLRDFGAVFTLSPNTGEDQKYASTPDIHSASRHGHIGSSASPSRLAQTVSCSVSRKHRTRLPNRTESDPPARNFHLPVQISMHPSTQSQSPQLLLLTPQNKMCSQNSLCSCFCRRSVAKAGANKIFATIFSSRRSRSV